MSFLTSGRRSWVGMLAVMVWAASWPAVARGQYLTRPQIPWRTMTTERFDIHYPVELEEWTRRVAVRIDGYAEAVDAVVGNRPSARITVIVEDPSNVANGFALPFMEGPVIFLWPTPPSPSPTFGFHRGWGEALAVHEYGHIAHLTFPSRNPRERWLWSLFPTQLSPVAIKAPAWVIEGYATVIEGLMTGSGRPFSAGRASVIRQWALDGRLPTYAQLNGSGAFLGGNMRYLVGSAFLEWLMQRRGDSSLVHLWRRMSARQQRTFDEAFTGVFGAPAPDMYAAFTVDVTERALQIRNRIREAGLVEGELVQRLSGATGDPAVSPDGSRLAVVVRSPTGPSRLVVWETNPPPDTAIQRLRQRVMERDSLDVMPFDSFPRPRRALATLRPVNGRSHEYPRWMPDSISILVSRNEPIPYGATRPDLFLWNTQSRELARVTHGAGIRHADPAPDGREAVGVRCHAGICSLVMVTLETGAWQELAAGTPDLVWHRPRFSPDGQHIAASYQEHGRWGVAIIDRRTQLVRRLTSDYSRHSPAFLPDGRSLVVVSEQGGIPNLEVVPVDSGASFTITQVTGAVLGPDVSRRDGSVWFLTLRSGGTDLRRRSATTPLTTALVSVGGSLAPAAPPIAPSPLLQSTDTSSTVQVHGYGLGPRQWRVLPGGELGADGGTAMLMIGNIDPIARLSIVGLLGTGSAGAYRGASLSAGLRSWPVGLEASIWKVDHEPSRLKEALAQPTADIRSTGGGLIARVGGEDSRTAWALRGGFTTGEVSNSDQTANRHVALGDARGRISWGYGTASASVTAGVSVAAGNTGDESWRRAVGHVIAAAGTSSRSVRAEWQRGNVTSAGPGETGRASEQFLVGGLANPFINPLYFSQRVPIPAVPSGFIQGRQFELLRVSLGGAEWEPYFLWVAGGDSITRYRKIAGLERSFEVSALGFARLPAVRLRGGAAWSFDEPFRDRLRGYFSITYTP